MSCYSIEYFADLIYKECEENIQKVIKKSDCCVEQSNKRFYSLEIYAIDLEPFNKCFEIVKQNKLVDMYRSELTLSLTLFYAMQLAEERINAKYDLDICLEYCFYTYTYPCDKWPIPVVIVYHEDKDEIVWRTEFVILLSFSNK